MIKDLPEEMTELTLAKGYVRMEIPTRSIPIAKIPIHLVCPISKGAGNEQPHPAIIQAMSRLTLYRIQEKARQEVDAGEISKATRHLQYLATHLLSQGERELAHVVLIEAEHIQQTQKFSKEGDKRIKYGTRALLLPQRSGE